MIPRKDCELSKTMSLKRLVAMSAADRIAWLGSDAHSFDCAAHNEGQWCCLEKLNHEGSTVAPSPLGERMSDEEFEGRFNYVRANGLPYSELFAEARRARAAEADSWFYRRQAAILENWYHDFIEKIHAHYSSEHPGYVFAAVADPKVTEAIVKLHVGRDAKIGRLKAALLDIISKDCPACGSYEVAKAAILEVTGKDPPG